MRKTVVVGLAILMLLSVCACSPPADKTYTVTKNGVNYVVDQENGTISDGTNIYQYTFSGNASSYRTEITYPDGSAYWWGRQTNSDGSGFGSGGWSDDYDENRYASGDVLLAVIEQGAPVQKESRPGKVLIVLILLGIGLFSALSPQTAWYLSNGWKFRDAEPSELALGLTRAGGVACIVVAVIVLLVW